VAHFLSDNVAGIHPAIVDALMIANLANDRPYGDDSLSASLDEAFSDLFDKQVAVIPCLTGTASNALAISLLVGPTQALLVHEGSHVYADECNAPEFFTGGARLTPICTADGKLTPRALERAVSRKGNIHAAQPAAISLAQATEQGGIYSVAEVSALGDFARRHDLKLHMDGARFANAVARLRCRPSEVTWQAGIDVLSFGATKNGCLAAEAVILFDPGHAPELRARAKRAGQLLSKMRFISAQLAALVEGDLWLSNARNANDMAALLAEGLAQRGIQLCGATEANMVFAALPAGLAGRLDEEGLAGYADEAGTMRLCTHWQTTSDEIKRLLHVLDQANPSTGES